MCFIETETEVWSVLETALHGRVVATEQQLVALPMQSSSLRAFPTCEWD